MRNTYIGQRTFLMQCPQQYPPHQQVHDLHSFIDYDVDVMQGCNIRSSHILTRTTKLMLSHASLQATYTAAQPGA